MSITFTLRVVDQVVVCPIRWRDPVAATLRRMQRPSCSQRAFLRFQAPYMTGISRQAWLHSSPRRKCVCARKARFFYDCTTVAPQLWGGLC
ncbi:MAG: hypothetical protein Q8P67_15535 [archaeon]|nr:hypothetical protein [archaeon]